MRAVRVCAALAIALPLLWGCGGARKSGLCEDFKFKPKKGDLAAEEQAAQAAWKQRKDVKQLEKAIGHWRKAVEINPKKTSNYVDLAHALYFWADGYLRMDEDKEEQMLKAFEEATFFAERALKIQNEDFQMSVCARDPFKKTARTIKKSDIPAIYWYASSLGKYGLAKSIVVVLENKDRIYAMMRAVRRLDPDFYYGGADRYLGAYYTKIPFPKGDVKKSKRHFNRSIQKEPNYLATRVLIAEMLAPKLKDRELFKEQLEYVIKADPKVIPALEPEAIIEKRKAKKLLGDIDDIFGAETKE